MIDTHESITIRFHQMMMRRSAIERLKMGCSMFETAKHIVRSSILAQNPQISPRQMREEIFLISSFCECHMDTHDYVINRRQKEIRD